MGEVLSIKTHNMIRHIVFCPIRYNYFRIYKDRSIPHRGYRCLQKHFLHGLDSPRIYMFLAKSCRIIGVLLKGRLMLYLYHICLYSIRWYCKRYREAPGREDPRIMPNRSVGATMLRTDLESFNLIVTPGITA